MARQARTANRRFYRVQGGHRPRRRISHWILLSLGLAATTWVLVFGETGWLRVRAEERDVQRLHQEVERLESSTVDLEAKVEDIQRPASPLLEKVARERFLMKREGEEVIHILDPAESGTLDKETGRN